MSVEEAPPVRRGVAEQWAYAGVRLSHTGKLVDVWVEDAGKGEELWYPRKAREIIGGIYTAYVERTEETTTKVGQPEWTGDKVADLELARAWSAQDHSARVQLEQQRRHDNAVKAELLDEALEPLLAIARGCRTGVARDALVATVMRRLLNVASTSVKPR